MMLVALIVDAPRGETQDRVVRVAPPSSPDETAYHDLRAAVAAVREGGVIELEAGVYHLTPTTYWDETCGNCEAESTRVRATVGLRVSGKNIRIVGPRDRMTEGADSTRKTAAVIRTFAGYGILFEDCQDCVLLGVTVTEGRRDTSANATDAAIVVKRSRVTIEQCRLEGNLGDSTTVARTVVGIMGIAGREGANLTATRNHIVRNSWDGIALYRGATAVIENNVIDGVDLACGGRMGGGRGVGIGVTWNATATIRGNLVKRYWKGIGAFLDAQVTVEDNVIEQVATWGLTLWDAGKGRPSGTFLRNVVYRTGACGASVIRESADPPAPGRFVGNVLVETGQDPRYDSGEPYCFQTPIALHAVPAAFEIADNVQFANRMAGGQPAQGDVADTEFRGKLEAIRSAHTAWPVLAQSDFWTVYASPKP
ncbi:MAG TPA: right-handed parallel beta-helix repeat-containing protein [Candidatus Eisenbacteria bacterium]|nr:right-handed parallel beta-helix repeat-containing protein [Candidatus Eisenbacteria bacterium]